MSVSESPFSPTGSIDRLTDNGDEADVSDELVRELLNNLIDMAGQSYDNGKAAWARGGVNRSLYNFASASRVLNDIDSLTKRALARSAAATGGKQIEGE